MIIMMKKYNEKKVDDEISQIISSTKMKAPENLKYRIMHQIEYESSLTPKHSQKYKKETKENGNVLKDLGSIYGVMYAVIALMTIIAYAIEGVEFYLSTEYWATVSFVGFVFSLFWLVSRLDGHLKSKSKYTSEKDLQN